MIRYLTVADEGKVGTGNIGSLVGVFVEWIVGGKGNAQLLIHECLAHGKTIAGITGEPPLYLGLCRAEVAETFSSQCFAELVGGIAIDAVVETARGAATAHVRGGRPPVGAAPLIRARDAP